MNLRSDKGPVERPKTKLAVLDTKTGTLHGFDGKKLSQVARLDVDGDYEPGAMHEVVEGFRQESKAGTIEANAEWMRIYGYAHNEYHSWIGALK